jgi:hypothetical protein
VRGGVLRRDAIRSGRSLRSREAGTSVGVRA